jgi:hypothetical protein
MSVSYVAILIGATVNQSLPFQSLEEVVLMPTVKDVLVKYMDGMTSVLQGLHGISRI